MSPNKSSHRPVRSLIRSMLAMTLVSVMCSCDQGGAGSKDASNGKATTKPASTTSTAADETSATTQKPLPSRNGGAMFHMPQPRVEFGSVADYETRLAKVTFINTGDQVLEVTRVQPTCGCTTTALEQKLFAPGEGSEIELTFKPKGSGKQTKLVKVYTNDATNPVQTISINATVTSTVKYTPKSLSFGVIPLKNGAAKSVVLTSEDDSYNPTTVRVSGNLSKYADATITKTTVPGSSIQSWKVEVVTKPDLPWGWHTGSLQIIGTVKNPKTGENRNKTVTVGMNANVQGTLRASDTMFRLMILGTNQQFTKRIQMYREDGKPFELNSATVVDGKPANMSVSVVPAGEKNGSGYELILTGTTGVENGSILGQVEISTDVPGEENVKIGIVGSIRKK
ncbi:MAG: DUF1573 domain-containing protein [Phycisphaerales bacterium]|nr:DUF1573 domain-containing protein [Phycisphaerales bacterium]